MDKNVIAISIAPSNRRNELIDEMSALREEEIHAKAVLRYVDQREESLCKEFDKLSKNRR